MIHIYCWILQVLLLYFGLDVLFLFEDGVRRIGHATSPHEILVQLWKYTECTPLQIQALASNRQNSLSSKYNSNITLLN